MNVNTFFMKHVWIFLFIIINGTCASAQTPDTVPPYKKNPHIPSFNILQTDSTWFTNKQLPKYQYTAIIYFSPTCGHCQFTAQDLVKKMDSLKNVFFVFVSYNSIEEIREFSIKYGLPVFRNVRIGRDPKYFIPSFYRVEATPFVAVYNRKGILMKVFDPPHKPAMEAYELINLIYKK